MGKTVPCCRGQFAEWGAAVSHQQSMVPARAGCIILRAYGEMKMCSPLFKCQEKVFSFLPCSVFHSVMVGFFFWRGGCFVLIRYLISYSLKLRDTQGVSGDPNRHLGPHPATDTCLTQPSLHTSSGPHWRQRVATVAEQRWGVDS